MPTTNHATDPAESGTFHYWEVGDVRGSVSLSALHCNDQRVLTLTDVAPSIASRVALTDAGVWVFDVLQSHTPGSTGWAPCSRPGACDVDAFVSSIADPLWQRLTAAGVTDARVFAELRPLFTEEFKESAA